MAEIAMPLLSQFNAGEMMQYPRLIFSVVLSSVVGLQPVAFAEPQKFPSISQQPDISGTEANDPLCYIITSNGRTTDLTRLCGSKPRGTVNDRPTNNSNAASTNSVEKTSRAQTQVGPSPLGLLPVPRLNLRNNRDTQLEDYR
ncbi:hypothetical protein BST81_21240 [Leptolyngbya sp. 'hensonii']|nr:hypothetical protein BST81_21240 [Leptolyngbya sp. 'hensonii']